MFKLLVAGLWIALISLFFRTWLFDLISSFLIQITIVGAVMTAFYTVRAKNLKPHIIWALLPLFILVAFPLSMLVQKTSIIEQPSDITLMTHNILYKTENAKEVAAQAKEAGADILGLQEVYPYQVEEIKDDLSYRDYYVSDCECSDTDEELGLITRYPIISAETMQIDVHGGRLIDSVLDIQGKKTRVIVVHLPAPIFPSAYNTRERGFARITELLEDSEIPTIVMGDLNTNLWSLSLRQFSADNKQLKNVAIEGSQASSWCGHNFKLSSLCLRIDHIFIDRDTIQLVNSRIGDEADSDHSPVISNVRFR